MISPDTANIVLTQIERAVDNPRRFVLFSRIATVLSALRNLGRVSDVDEMFARQADIADEITESSYSLLKGLIWAIPVLGFIGTVVGLSAAIGSFGAVLSAGGSGIEQLKEGLQKITVGLAVAFDTTLVGLLQALALQMLMTLEKSGEEQFLDDCRDYCHRRIVARLRVLPLEAE
ncbi:hypothetical protein FACS1894107_17190 [Planctomycetales bacterium]|nr:hypothetical protein FACS1894107_17190 [Planctomycetales bacterium]